MKIEFYKDKKLVDIDPMSISYFEAEKIIKKDSEENIIILDFLNKHCWFKLKTHDTEVGIPVLMMNYQKEGFRELFTYTLVSEPEVENVLIIHQK
jgi:hypothetical protein